LQESDREVQELHQQAQAAAEERSQLQAALQAAASQRAEHDQLVADLTRTLQQQSNALQVCCC
jgi:chromosome segregation ATPase